MLHMVDPQVHVIAMPRIAVALGLEDAVASLTRSIGTMVLAASMLAAGTVGDRWGLSRTLLTGVGGVLLAALLCALAPSTGVLIAARVLMGVATALVFAMCMAFLPTLFQGRKLGYAYAIWLAADSAALFVFGVVGGILLELAGWRAVYLITVVMAAAAAAAVLLWVPENRASEARPADVPGVVLAGVALLALTYGLTGMGSAGWAAPQVYGPLAVSALALTLFIQWELTCASPCVPLHLFRNPAFSASALVGMVFNAVNGVFIGMYPIMAAAAGSSSSLTGIVASMIGVGSVLGAAAAAYGRTALGLSPRTMYTSGMLVLAAALASQLLTTESMPAVMPFIGLLTAGIGIMWVQHPQSEIMLGAAEKDELGAVGSVKTAFGQLGMGTGLAVAAPLLQLFLAGGASAVVSYASAMAWTAALVLPLWLSRSHRTTPRR
jgi:predicted MFS family arabinose efflux permease